MDCTRKVYGKRDAHPGVQLACYLSAISLYYILKCGYLGFMPKEGQVVFFIALFFVILLGIFAVIVIVQNLETLVYTPIHLTVFSQHLPGAPIVLLCVLCAFLGALALYLSVVRSANRDKQEIKELRTRIEELERAPTRSPSGGLVGNFAPSVVPMPGFASGNQAGSGSPGSSAPPGQRQPPPNALQNTSPSATSNNLSLPPRMFPPSQQPPQQPQMGGGPHPPFPHA